MKNVLIIGAGLCGSLLALRLAQKGFQVTLMEKRPDLRKVTLDAGRSINLALSNRGLKSLEIAGLKDHVQELLIPMTGRMIHEKFSGKSFLSPYSGREEEYINSVSRPGLNKLLLNELETFPNVKLHFNQECTSIDFETPSATFKEFDNGSEKTVTADVIFGTDGSGSAVRQAMVQDKNFLFSISQQWLGHGYKELEISAQANGDYKIFKNALHIWPRGEYMLIALPNLDGSFTVTLFLPHKGEPYSFENLNSEESIKVFFENEFPDVLALIPDLHHQFKQNPIGNLGTVKCSPWHHSGKVLLMGDAAHAMVPFYAQGMNSSFEDVRVFAEVLETYETEFENENIKGIWKKVFEKFQEKRIQNAQAICDLSLDNFEEMKAHTGLPIFQTKRKIEVALEAAFPEKYNSKYALVTFREEIPYHEALALGRAQDKAILTMVHSGELKADQDLSQQLKSIQDKTKILLKEKDHLEYLNYSSTDF